MGEELNCFLLGLFPFIVFALLPVAITFSVIFNELISIIMEKIFGSNDDKSGQ